MTLTALLVAPGSFLYKNPTSCELAIRLDGARRASPRRPLAAFREGKQRLGLFRRGRRKQGGEEKDPAVARSYPKKISLAYFRQSTPAARALAAMVRLFPLLSALPIPLYRTLFLR